MGGARGIVGGLLGLTLLDAALTTKFATGGSSAVGGLFESTAHVLDYWLDRTQPLIGKPCTGSGSSSVDSVTSGATQVGEGLATGNPGSVVSGVGKVGKGIWHAVTSSQVTPLPTTTLA